LRTRSLQTRVTAVAALVLVVFVALASLALEQAFQASARAAREERLLGQIYLLMAAADTQSGALVLPLDLAESRFSLPGSGLYGQVSDSGGRPVWRSISALGQGVPFDTGLAPGERRFQESVDKSGRPYFVEGFGVTWTIGPSPRGYTFSVAEDLTEYGRELSRFRASLAGWLGGLSLILLVALLAALRWGLAPLRRVADEVAAVEAGTQERLRGRYPRELRALTDNLNALLAHESARQTRLGNALADLAHSLKTPLAVMRGALGETRHQTRISATGGPDDPVAVQALRDGRLAEQLSRMEEIVTYQLERARPRPMAALAPPLPVDQALERLLDTLAKLHADRHVSATLDLESQLVFRGIEGDLLEVLGNLLDNAYKWCRTRIAVRGRREHGFLVLCVEDDGPGIPLERVREIGERGTRADLATPGHGIGLAVVREICSAYGGGLDIGSSALGGALVRARLGA
jgi:two-component system, OmpR family, sensor histidine kinase PhoQ